MGNEEKRLAGKPLDWLLSQYASGPQNVASMRRSQETAAYDRDPIVVALRKRLAMRRAHGSALLRHSPRVHFPLGIFETLVSRAPHDGASNRLNSFLFRRGKPTILSTFLPYRRRLGRYYPWQFFIHLPLQIPEERLTDNRRTMEFVLKRKIIKSIL